MRAGKRMKRICLVVGNTLPVPAVMGGAVEELITMLLDQNEIETIDHLILQMEKERGLDRSAAMADMRFSFIEKVCEQTVVKPRESKE